MKRVSPTTNFDTDFCIFCEQVASNGLVVVVAGNAQRSPLSDVFEVDVGTLSAQVLHNSKLALHARKMERRTKVVRLNVNIMLQDELARREFPCDPLVHKDAVVSNLSRPLTHHFEP